MLTILKTRGFVAYLVIAFLNAFTDLGHKIIIQNTIFKFYDGTMQIVLTALVNACIVLPFVMFFTPSGFLADKFPKDRIIKVAAALAIPLTLLVTLCYSMGWFEAAFACTLLLGIQAAFYSPAKYGYIKELTGKEHLAGANAFVQAVTIVAILGGTVAFSALFEHFLLRYLAPDAHTIGEMLHAIAPLGWLLVGCSVVEFVVALRLEQKRPTDVALHFNIRKYATFGYLRSNISALRRSQVIWLSIVGISVFWGINQVVLASFPAYVKETLGVSNTTISNGLMGLGGIGIIIGSLIAGKASEDFIETGIIPLGALGITASLFVLPLVGNLWLLAALFLVYGIMGGLFIIPLNALIQFNASDEEAGTVLAGSNFMQNLLMSCFLVLTAVVASLWTLDTRLLFYAMAVVALVGSVFTLSKLPQAFVRYAVALLVAQRYTLRVSGLRNIPSTGGALLLSNHASWFDWAVLQIACPRPVRFVMIRSIYEHPVLKPLLDIFGVIPIAPGKGSEESLKLVREALERGEVVAIFPEGRISRNGQLAEFKRGFERAIQGTGAAVIPVYLRGLWGTAFSYATTRLRRSTLERGKRSISVTFGSRLPDTTTTSAIKQHITELSIVAWREYAATLPPLHLAWMRTAKAHASSIAVAEGKQRLTFAGLLAKTLAFSNALQAALTHTSISEKKNKTSKIGVLLPTSIDATLVIFSLWMHGKTPVLIDYSGGATDLTRSIELAGVEIILTSRAFQQEISTRFPEVASTLASPLVSMPSSKTLVYTDDVHRAAERSPLRGIWGSLVAALAPVWLLKALFVRSAAVKPDSLAVVLFAGTDETLRAVELTHTHIGCTIKQILHVLNPREDDVLLTPLPLCTAFGFIVGMLTPLTNGFTAVFAESSDAPTLGRTAARNEATLLIAEPAHIRAFTTDETLHPLMFSSLRLTITGTNGITEQCDEATQAAYRQKFGSHVYGGFGTTETIPVASVNVPDALNTSDWRVQTGTKAGTVGLPLPGCAFKIVDTATHAEKPYNGKPYNEKPLGEYGTVMIGTPYEYDDNGDIAWTATAVRGSLDEEGFLTLDNSSDKTRNTIQEQAR